MLQKWTRYLLMVTTAALLISIFPSTYAEAAPNTKLIVKGKTIVEKLSTITEKGRTLVPLRIVSEAIDAQVKWDAKSSTATVQKWGERLIFKIDAKQAHLQGASAEAEMLNLDTPARLKNGTVYVPLRVITHTFGYEMSWLQGKISIHSPLSEKQKQVLYRGSLKDARQAVIQLSQRVHFMNPPLNVTILDENYDASFIFPEGKALGYYYIYGDTISWIELKDDFLVCTWQAHLKGTSSGHPKAFADMNIKDATGKNPRINKNMFVYSQGTFGDSSFSEHGKIDKNGVYTALAHHYRVAGEVMNSEGTTEFILPGEVRTDHR